MDSNLSSCAAGNGGALWLQDQATLHVISSSFWNNTANKFGGAVDVGGQTMSLVKSSNFTANNAGRDGAALYMMENAQVRVG